MRTYATVWVWPRHPDQTVAEALQGEPCEPISATEAQGEAQSAAPDGFNKAVAMSEEPHTEAAPRLAPSRRNGLAHEDPVVAGPAEPDSD